MKNFTTRDPFMFQIFFHSSWTASVFEQLPSSLPNLSKAKWYALRTVNIPFFNFSQARKYVPLRGLTPMLHIIFASSSLKTSCTRAVFHQLVFSSNSSFTLTCLSRILTDDHTRCAFGFGTHGSSQIIFSSPTCQISPYFRSVF
jgi:hypothetical protein